MIIKDVDYIVTYKKGTEDEITFKLKKITTRTIKAIGKFITEANTEQVAIEYGTVLVESSIVDWENVFDGEGKVVPYTKEKLGELPVEVFNFLCKEIAEQNNLIPTANTEQEIKN